MTVKEFRGEYRWLSNFWLVPTLYEGAWYCSVEHAYQAAKSTDKMERIEIACWEKPGDAKRAGKHIRNPRPGWEDMKLSVMEELVRFKFANSRTLRTKLLNTVDAQLQEGNNWGDEYWGVVLLSGVGENHLGKIIMKVRKELLNV